MKFLIRNSSILLLCIVLFGCNKFKPTKASKDSYDKVVRTIDWKNATLQNEVLEKSCLKEAKKKTFGNLPKNLALEKDTFKNLALLMSGFDEAINFLIKKYDLENKLSEDTGIFKIEAKDKIYDALNSSENEKELLNKVKRRLDKKPIDWNGKEKEFDKDIKKLSNFIGEEREITSEKSITDSEGCSVRWTQAIDILKMSRTEIRFSAFCHIHVGCNCSQDKTTSNISYSDAYFRRDFTAKFPNDKVDFNSLIFYKVEKPKYWLYAECCEKNIRISNHNHLIHNL